MDQNEMIVSDIPLPGEAYDFKAKIEIGDAKIKAAEVDTTQQQQRNIVTENEAQKIAAEFLEDVTDESETVECVTSEIITETVAELQMEVEQAVATMDTSDNSIITIDINNTDEIMEESMETLRLEASFDEQQTNKSPVVITVEENEPPVVITGEDNDNPVVITVEEPADEEIPNEKTEEEQPAKKNKRSNSTIEAIKNDWITIEEINDEISETNSPKPEPIIMEPEKNEEEIVAKPQTKVLGTINIQPQVIVIETLEDECSNADDDITIEIIDHTLTNSEPSVVMAEADTGEQPTKTIVEEQPIIETVEQQSTIVELEPTTDTVVEQQKTTTETVIEQQETETVVEQQETETIIEQQPETETVEEQPQPAVVEVEHPQVQEEIGRTKDDIQETIIEEKKQANVKSEITANNNKSTISRRGRPAKGIQREGDKLPIPCHVMGRNVDNPQEDLISNGRTPPKPRLGVKVPYRFLTSQIVSKEEIADELIELTNKRNPAPDPPAGGDIFFASKLTQRLATKIANANKKKTPTTQTENKQESTSGIPKEALNNTTVTTATGSKEKTIGDNSDLLAILEGDVDVDWTKEVRNSKTNDEETKVINVSVVTQARLPDVSVVPVTKKLDPEMEREIALKQLAQLPKKKAIRGRPRKYHYPDRVTYNRAPEPQIKVEPVKKEVVSPPKPPVEQQKTTKELSKPPVDIKQAVTKISQKIQDNVKQETNNMDIDTDLKLNPKRVTKTYSRKEAVVDIPVPADLELIVNETETPSALPEKEKPSKNQETPQKTSKTIQHTQEIRRSKRSAPPEVTLISKRARVIKKKVIWDPAEVPKTKVLNAIRRAQAMELKAKRQQQQQQQQKDESSTDSEDEKQKVEKRQENEEQKKVDKTVEKKEDVRKLRKNRILNKVQKKLLMKRQLRSLKSRFRSTNGELKSSIALSKKKKQVMAEIAKNVQKNRKSELDRLLGDEGAVNMLYSVKAKSRGALGRPKIISQKDILNRAKAVKETLTSQSEEGKALRNSTPIRKKSRDSIRSSLQSPPPSPTVSYRGIGAEASRIIRRHSSSFSSDSSTPRRLSVEQHDEISQRVLRKKPGTPEKKTEKLTSVEKKKINVEMTKNFDKKRKVFKKDNEFSVVETDYKEIMLKKCNNIYQIVLNYPTNAKLKDSISLQMFNELNTVLNKLSSDNSCKIVALTSKGKSFSNGLDFSFLIQTTAEKRSQAALEMSKTLKEFIFTISKFPKILIACLHSSVSYLGCTILPYFDYVLSTEGATLSADYPRLGQSPEGAPLVSLSPKIGQTLTSELLLMGRKLTAKEGLENGLINQIEKQEKLEETLGKIGEDISSKSQQSLLATKSLLRQPMLAKLEEALDLEQKLLIEHWTSSECQQTFKKLLQEQEVW